MQLSQFLKTVTNYFLENPFSTVIANKFAKTQHIKKWSIYFSFTFKRNTILSYAMLYIRGLLCFLGSMLFLESYNFGW